MTDYFIIAYFNILFTHLQVITVKIEGLFNPSLVTTVAAQCLPCGKQKMCTQVQPTLILLLLLLLSREGKPIRPNFLVPVARRSNNATSASSWLHFYSCMHF